ncbi:Flagellar hook-length control protein [Vibrio ruber DSM 16370]|uniref:Flagellar hook-length control protein n=1 Tax=Vibrio ruber (strain DSM 16370 / JCM 11486 / BCRC 17186 / CECT 7878 / LMG 23124 / VR1) TaxID=1123498 RepID=A0A1R4LE61_VIBR1|nr:flagellar hook-length control protein FliK [Vibrio ruber]SJN54835.1 Flagellar hook-length control protein [Vibrio ruber DSM 16370]
MNINLTPTSGTQKAQSHPKTVSDDAVVGDVAESSQESGGFFAKLAALFKGEEAISGKSAAKSGEAKNIEAVSDAAGDMSADALLSDNSLSDKELSDELSDKKLTDKEPSDKALAGEKPSQTKLTEADASKPSALKNASENIDDVDNAQAQTAAVKTSGEQKGDSVAAKVLRSDSDVHSVAKGAVSSLKSTEQSTSSAQKEAALQTMGEGEAVLNRLKGAEQQLMSQNGKKLPASDATEPAKQTTNSAQVNSIDPATLQDTTVQGTTIPAGPSLSQIKSDIPSPTKDVEQSEQSLTGEKALTAEISQLAEGATRLNDSSPSNVASDVQVKNVAHKEATVSSAQLAAGTNIQGVSNQNIVGQADIQTAVTTDGAEHARAAALAGAEGNSEKAALSQKLLQSLNQDMSVKADSRHHTHVVQQQFAAQQTSPVNSLTQPIQSDGSANSPISLTGDSAVSQAALQTLSASAVGREQWIRQRLAGFGDGQDRTKGMIDDGTTGKEGHFAHQLSSLTGQQTASVPSHIRADAAQTPTSVYLAKDAMAADQLSERVQMMMSKNLKNIDIRLDPPELGRMHIRMNMSGDATTVHFTVATPQAREALEHSMPRLRDMLSQQGVQLGETSVQHQGSGQQQQGYAASGQGQSSGRNALLSQDSVFHDDNPDTGVKLDVNVSSKRDGISYYA